MDILIIKIGAIGDVVMALPMVDAITKKYPGSGITWVCGETVSPLIKACNSSINIISIDEKKLLRGTTVERLLSLVKVWKMLFARRFDLVITAHGDYRYRFLSLPVRGKERRSFGKRNGRRWPVPGRHHTGEYIRLVTDLDGPDAAQGVLPVLQVALPEHIKYELSGPSSPLIALAPGGAKNVLRDDAVRRWPAEKYAALAKLLLRDGMRVAITGALSDMWVMDSFRELKVLNFIGKADLTGLIALYRACDLVITHDSGPLHLAALAGTAQVSLFGPTNPGEKAYTLNGSRILWGGQHLACRPCYDGKTYAVCTNNICMQEISVDEVYKAAREMLSEEILKP